MNQRGEGTLLLLGIGLVVVLGGCRPSGMEIPEPTPPTALPQPGTSPLATVSPLAVPDERFLSSLGGRVLFHRKGENGVVSIFVRDVATGEETRLTEGPGNSFDPAWSPDGTLIVYSSDQNQQSPYCTLWLMNADGSNPHSLLEAGSFFEIGATWSPDGTRIAYQSDRSGNPEIYIMDLASGERTNVTQHSNLDANPAWSPDGTQIAFASDRSGNPEIWIVSVDGTDARQLTDRPLVGDWRPAWSPNGQSLIFESFPSVAPRMLFIQDVDGGDARETPSFSIWNTWPFWVREDLILFAASEQYDSDIHQGSPANLYFQDLRTGEIYLFTSGAGDDGRPSWRP
jgi:Tol biopolymer transport system component